MSEKPLKEYGNYEEYAKDMKLRQREVKAKIAKANKGKPAESPK